RWLSRRRRVRDGRQGRDGGPDDLGGRGARRDRCTAPEGPGARALRTLRAGLRRGAGRPGGARRSRRTRPDPARRAGDPGPEPAPGPSAPSAPGSAAEPVDPAEPDDPDGLARTQLDEQEILDLSRRFAAVRRSVGALERALLQGPRKFSRRDLEQQQDIPQRMTAVYWRSLGFAPVDEDTVVFTEEDAYAIGDLSAIVEDGALSERAFSSITRGLGFHMGRLAMWITEALVDEAKHTGGASDADA